MNVHCGPKMVYKVGNWVLLSTFHCQREYMQCSDHRIAKFMCRFDSLYIVITANPQSSSYTLELPDYLQIFPTFYSSFLRFFILNDNLCYSSRAHSQLGPIVMADGATEYFVERILDRCPQKCSYQYLIRWQGYGPKHDFWLPSAKVEDLIVLDKFLTSNLLPKR